MSYMKEEKNENKLQLVEFWQVYQENRIKM